MGFRLKEMVFHAKHHLRSTRTPCPVDVPRGHFAIYVGDDAEEKNHEKRHVVPISYLKHPLFQDLLYKAADEFGFDQLGGIRLPCSEEEFTSLTSRIN
ncbi:unnamed protein product [Prunus brigantina]